MTRILQSLLVLAAILVFAGAQNDTVKPKVKAVVVVFRHGDRAPDTNAAEHFPDDPHVNSSFFPYGVGGLTNAGKKREYQLGKKVRTLYGDLLGKAYFPSEIIARSTDYERAKMSLQAALAGIFPPMSEQQWDDELLWQPTVADYVPAREDVLMIPEECPQYLEELANVKSLPYFREKIEAFTQFVKGLEKHTGRKMSLPNDMFNLWHALKAESSLGLKLPQWTATIFPDGRLYEGTLLEYEVVSYNQKLKRLNGGMLLRNVTESFKKVIKGDSKIKMTLLSGHETNVAALLSALGLYTLHIPEYGSAVFVELLADDTDYYVKVRYYLGIPEEVQEMQIPDCPSPCPFKKFVELMADVTPSDEEMVCIKKKPANSIEKMEEIITIAQYVERQLKQMKQLL